MIERVKKVPSILKNSVEKIKKTKVLYAVLVIFVVVMLSIFIWNVVRRRDKLKPITKIDNGIILVKASWCSYCKRLEPTWKKLKKENKDKSFYEYDIDLHRSFIEKFDKKDNGIKIDGFPTIILIKNKVPKKFEGKNDFDTINKFINE